MAPRLGARSKARCRCVTAKSDQDLSTREDFCTLRLRSLWASIGEIVVKQVRVRGSAVGSYPHC